MRKAEWIFFFFFGILQVASGAGCGKSSAAVGFQGDLSMDQHQVRGRITVLDDCSFSVTGLDMIQGSDEVFWWGAAGADFYNLTQGFPLSGSRLNQTYSNASMVVILQNATWDEVRVLAVWDKVTASSFGHLMLDTGELTNTPQTVFDNCIQLSNSFRLRWSLVPENSSVELGLEASIPETKYMAFGWAKPNASTFLMLGADVVVAGFRNRETPFAEDYYINKYSECNWDFQNPQGVCPDFLHDSSKNDSVNSTRVSYGQHLDGVALIRYLRPLGGQNSDLDVEVDPSQSMTVIWALGALKPPDSLRHFFLPQNHGGPGKVAFGHRKLALAEAVDECEGPLVAEEIEADVIVADRGSPLVVTADGGAHYPNPPFPSKVFYINKIEAPVLKVERGVPVIFSIQAGHDIAFYITSDPVGGASNPNETVYAGGQDFHGVPSRPMSLEWLPDRTTPDEVYYQAYFEKKMGWKVQVVDGGLSDMYNSSVMLAEMQATLFWTVAGANISFAVRAQRKSGYMAIAFGREMVNSFGYVAWVGGDGTGHVKPYWIDGRDAASIHPTSEKLWDVKCSSEKGVLTFEFSRGLQPVCQDDKDKICRKNIVDVSTPLKVVWAMGAKWDSDFPSNRNMHDRTSRRATVVYLERGAAEADREVKPVLVVHGFMMFLAWGVLFPGGVIAARYLKHLGSSIWFQGHRYLQYSGLTVMLLAFVFAAAELRGLHTETLHVKLALLAMLSTGLQPVNAYFRPAKAAAGEQASRGRAIWEFVHVCAGRASLLLGAVTLATGMSLLADIYGSEHLRGFEWGLFAWLVALVALVAYLELRHSWDGQRKQQQQLQQQHVQVLDSEDEDEGDESLKDLLPPSSRGMEVQLEAFG